MLIISEIIALIWPAFTYSSEKSTLPDFIKHLDNYLTICPKSHYFCAGWPGMSPSPLMFPKEFLLKAREFSGRRKSVLLPVLWQYWTWTSFSGSAVSMALWDSSLSNFFCARNRLMPSLCRCWYSRCRSGLVRRTRSRYFLICSAFLEMAGIPDERGGRPPWVLVAGL